MFRLSALFWLVSSQPTPEGDLNPPPLLPRTGQNPRSYFMEVDLPMRSQNPRSYFMEVDLPIGSSSTNGAGSQAFRGSTFSGGSNEGSNAPQLPPRNAHGEAAAAPHGAAAAAPDLNPPPLLPRTAATAAPRPLPPVPPHDFLKRSEDNQDKDNQDNDFLKRSDDFLKRSEDNQDNDFLKRSDDFLKRSEDNQDSDDDDDEEEEKKKKKKTIVDIFKKIFPKKK